jgi:branched-chain amino acid transport system substrate-binding protein
MSAHLLFETVLPKAGSVDPEAVRKAALEIDIPEGGTVFGFGVKFAPPDHPSAGQNLRAIPVLMQWQEQKPWVVYPAAFAVRDPLLPLPTWEERSKGITKFVK